MWEDGPCTEEQQERVVSAMPTSQGAEGQGRVLSFKEATAKQTMIL
jgi:hypothetical protein